MEGKGKWILGNQEGNKERKEEREKRKRRRKIILELKKKREREKIQGHHKNQMTWVISFRSPCHLSYKNISKTFFFRSYKVCEYPYVTLIFLIICDFLNS